MADLTLDVIPAEALRNRYDRNHSTDRV